MNRIEMEFGKDTTPPSMGYPTDAGLDIYAPADIVVPAKGFTGRIGLGIIISIPLDCFGEIQERSSQGARGLFTMGNIIDPGYDGEIHTTIGNMSGQDITIKKGDKVCQLLIPKMFRGQVVQVDKVVGGQRGKNGHGSTG